MSKGKKPTSKKTPATKRSESATQHSRAREVVGRPGASARAKNTASKAPAKPYTHPTHELAGRPEIGMQAQFRKKKAPKTYRYDSSLSPGLDWDGQNSAREQGEALIKRILDATSLDDARAAAEELARISKPFLNWAGKLSGCPSMCPQFRCSFMSGSRRRRCSSRSSRTRRTRRNRSTPSATRSARSPIRCCAPRSPATRA
jgi:hypothetical protein